MSRKIPESAWRDILARRAKDEPVASIAEHYGCSPALIYSVLKKAAAGMAGGDPHAAAGATLEPTIGTESDSAAEGSTVASVKPAVPAAEETAAPPSNEDAAPV